MGASSWWFVCGFHALGLQQAFKGKESVAMIILINDSVWLGDESYFSSIHVSTPSSINQPEYTNITLYYS